MGNTSEMNTNHTPSNLRILNLDEIRNNEKKDKKPKLNFNSNGLVFPVINNQLSTANPASTNNQSTNDGSSTNTYQKSKSSLRFKNLENNISNNQLLWR